MARPRKRGLDYFPVDVDVFDDEKIFELNNEFGPLGEAVYLRILCLIYRNGYYYRYQSMDRLASMILKSIGGRWCQSKEKIQQVIRFLAECNLLSSELMQENVMTSAGIQRRYLNVARRRSETIEEYNLLGNDEGLFPTPEKTVSVTETPVFATETGVFADNNYTKQSKAKQSKAKQSKEEESKVPDGTAASASGDGTEPLLALIRSTICPVNSQIEKDLDAWLAHMEPACIEYAIEEAARSGARTMRYVYAILQRMLDEGITSGGKLAGQKGRRSREKYSFEKDGSAFANYFDEENLYGGGL